MCNVTLTSSVKKPAPLHKYTNKTLIIEPIQKLTIFPWEREEIINNSVRAVIIIVVNLSILLIQSKQLAP